LFQNPKAKGSDGLGLSEPFFCCQPQEEHMEKKKEAKENKDVIAVRKACNADGTGLSHYILMDKKAK